ncbi:methyl-accepting chemotaxis protein [Paenibacillus psychroresistens]|uniref:Methyl-accepting chemotaxis protein n=1 Tax=Paenibacillus psychroresistens TaxID=1778678 RepID=A0A6B8RI14_9BACL|nr:methyl-accepting chemotaxis protein [Paenibacillus psychroresistens]QGQ95527.1 methyl-accepting chemotaxis protein [Paenibacillus psychroresistens]
MKIKQVSNKSKITLGAPSLRMKMTAMFLLFTLIPLFISTLFFSIYYKQVMRDEIHTQELNLAEANIAAIESFVARRIDYAGQMIDQHGEFKSGNKVEIQKTLKSFADIDHEVVDYAFVDKNGSSMNIGEITDIKSLDYYLQTRDSKSPFTTAALNKQSGRNDMIVAVPILDKEGRYIGALNSFIDTASLSKLVKGIKLGETGYGMLISAQGMILTDRIGQSLDQAFNPKLADLFRTNVLGNKQGHFEFSLNNSAKMASFQTAPSVGWKLVIIVSKSEAYEIVSKSNQVAIGFVAVTAFIVAVLAIIISSRTTRPMIYLTEIVKKLATGDLTPRLKLNRKDELGQLAMNMNIMLDSLSGIIAQVDQAAEQVTTYSLKLAAASNESVQTSHHIVDSINQIVQGVEAQLQGTEQSTKAMEEMSIVVQRITEFSSEVSEVSIISVQEAGLGNEAIQEAVLQMAQIRKTVGETALDIQQLESYSQKIGEIIGVITDISNQTQLLSLNASIEAARAGEHGRGFAVVGNEVKKLAEQTNSSVSLITGLIRSVQATTLKAVSMMNRGMLDVEKGAIVMDTAGNAFQRISLSFKSISDQIQEVSAASEQMSAGTEEVTASMGEMVHVTKAAFAHSQGIAGGAQQQLASMGEISSASEALSKMAQELHETLAKFKITG